MTDETKQGIVNLIFIFIGLLIGITAASYLPFLNFGLEEKLDQFNKSFEKNTNEFFLRQQKSIWSILEEGKKDLKKNRELEAALAKLNYTDVYTTQFKIYEDACHKIHHEIYSFISWLYINGYSFFACVEYIIEHKRLVILEKESLRSLARNIHSGNKSGIKDRERFIISQMERLKFFKKSIEAYKKKIETYLLSGEDPQETEKIINSFFSNRDFPSDLRKNRVKYKR